MGRNKDSFIHFIVKSVTNDQMKTFFPEIEKLSGGIFMFGVKSFSRQKKNFKTFSKLSQTQP